MTYRACGKTDEMVAVYEQAHKNDPNERELADALFAAYLRTAEFGKAQALSMKLYKQNDDEMLYWAICCLLLQVDSMCHAS